MDDILLLTDKVRNTLILGESHFREFKSALDGRPDNKKPRSIKSICADIGEALVSFANADGGAILIGVEDDGTITGILHSEEEIQTMLNHSPRCVWCRCHPSCHRSTSRPCR